MSDTILHFHFPLAFMGTVMCVFGHHAEEGALCRWNASKITHVHHEIPSPRDDSTCHQTESMTNNVCKIFPAVPHPAG
jgi:hypothetical protein